MLSGRDGELRQCFSYEKWKFIFYTVLLSGKLSTDAWNGKELQSYNLKSNGQLCSLIAVAVLRRVMSVTVF